MVSILPIELNSLIQGYLGETLDGLPMKYAQYHSGASVPKVNGDFLKIFELKYPGKNIERLSTLHSLEKLVIVNCRIDISILANLSSLKELKLYDCFFDASNFSRLEKLEKLTLNTYQAYTDINLSALPKMNNLRELFVSGLYKPTFPNMKDAISLRKLHFQLSLFLLI